MARPGPHGAGLLDWRDAGRDELVADLIKDHSTQAAYAGFYTKHPTTWFAYSAGRRTVIRYSDFSVGANPNLDRIVKRDIDDLRESPSLTIIELLQKEGAEVSYNDPYFPTIGKGRRYDLQMKRSSLDNLGQYDCVLIVTDHSDYDYARIVQEAQLVVDSRNATKGIKSDKIVHC